MACTTQVMFDGAVKGIEELLVNFFSESSLLYLATWNDGQLIHRVRLWGQLCLMVLAIVVKSCM